jgi:hypothetical protein
MPTQKVRQYEISDDDEDTLIIKKSPHPQFPPIDLIRLSVVNKGRPLSQLTDQNILLSVKRLLVVVPNMDVDEAQLSRKIWTLASNYNLDVLIISVVNNPEESMSASRRLTTLAAMIRDSHFKIEKQVIFSHSWDKALRPFWRQTDLILCPAETQHYNFWGRDVPLSQFLSDRLKVPVYTFSGLYQSSVNRLPFWLRKIPFWLGFLLIVAAGFYFESDVDQTTLGWVGQILLIFVVILEISLLYIWTLIAG